MTLAQPTAGSLGDPVPIRTFPFVDTIEVGTARLDPDEPSPCLPSATSIWYVVRAEHAGALVVDLAGSTPLDPVVRLYRQPPNDRSPPIFVGCASPAWNAQLSLEIPVQTGETVLAQVGTSESLDGRLVIRAELRSVGHGRGRSTR